MKKIFVLTTLIAGILITMACGNSIAPKEQVVAEFVKKDSLQFTPEEIAYNDSVKDIPMDYVQLEVEVFGNLLNDYENINKLKTELNGKTQEEAYLHAYHYLCDGVITNVTIMYTRDEYNTLFRPKYEIKILNNKEKNIIPIIDFPDRRQKEDSIWNDWVKFITANPLEGRTPDMYKQPIVKKGECMILEMNRKDLESK